MMGAIEDGLGAAGAITATFLTVSEGGSAAWAGGIGVSGGRNSTSVDAWASH